MAIVVVGTDTGIGKTVFSAGLCATLKADYFKPVQAGLEEETDSEVVARLSQQYCHPETYRLAMPASPHLAAEAENIKIEPSAVSIPKADRLIVEGAGGLMVPLNRKTLYIDAIAEWKQPIVLCARTQLGTINHSLLSLAALRERGCTIIGIAFIGEPEAEVEQSICELAEVSHLGRLPFLSPLDKTTLIDAFNRSIDLKRLQKAL